MTPILFVSPGSGLNWLQVGGGERKENFNSSFTYPACWNSCADFHVGEFHLSGRSWSGVGGRLSGEVGMYRNPALQAQLYNPSNLSQPALKPLMIFTFTLCQPISPAGIQFQTQLATSDIYKINFSKAKLFQHKFLNNVVGNTFLKPHLYIQRRKYIQFIHLFG